MRLWRGILAGTLALCLTVPVCAAPVEDTVAQQRQEDLDFLYDTLKRGHPDLFATRRKRSSWLEGGVGEGRWLRPATRPLRWICKAWLLWWEIPTLR